jgi:hypothetical protein
MADTKISALSAVTDVQATDEFVLARAGTTKKIDASDLATGLSGLIAYAEITSPVTVSATVESSPDLVVTSGSLTYTAVPIKIEFSAYEVSSGATAASFTVLNLWDSSTDLGRIGLVGHASGAQPVSAAVNLIRYLTPSAGSHEYRIRAWRAVSNGTVQAGAGGAGTADPAYIRVSLA